MTDHNTPRNVLPFPAQHARLDGERRREDDQEHHAMVKHQAEAIRAHAKRHARIPLSDRAVLARNLGNLLYPTRQKRKRGWITDVLVEAGISNREDSTKRLRRYAIDTTKQPSAEVNPKSLGANLQDYLKIATAYAHKEKLDEDAVLVGELCAGVGFLADEYGSEAEERYAELMPLYRVLSAVAEAVARRPEATEFIDGLYRHRWEALGRRAVWHMDNALETDPESASFVGERYALMPKVELVSIAAMRLTLEPRDVEEGIVGLESDETMHVDARLTLWMVLTPSGPSRLLRPELYWSWKTKTTGKTSISGEETPLHDVNSLGFIQQLRESQGSWVRVRLDVPFFDVYDEVHGLLLECAGTEGKNIRTYLDLGLGLAAENRKRLSPAALRRCLVDTPRFNDLWTDYEPGYTSAPKGTLAACLESSLLLGHGAERVRDALHQDVVELVTRMRIETEAAREEHRQNFTEILSRLGSKKESD